MSTVDRFKDLSRLVAFSADIMAPRIDDAAALIRTCFRNGGKVLVCGNGGSAAHAQHLAAELIGRFHNERDGYPAIALTADTSTMTAIANDYGYENVFARQLKALGQPGDMLIAISTSGYSKNIVNAIRAANRGSMATVLITRELHALLAGPIWDNDLAIECVIGVPSTNTARIQEVHQLVIHCLCERIERSYQ